VAGGSCTITSGCVCATPTCGGSLHTPCAANYCSVGHFNSALGICASCGEAGQACCNAQSSPGIPDCYDGNGCSDPGAFSGICQPCGGAGPVCPSAVCGLINQPPCPGNVCSEGHYDSDLGLCAQCGEMGQVCCDLQEIGYTAPSTQECYDGTLCGGNERMANGKNCAAPCGADGQAPCVGSTPSACQPGAWLFGTTCSATMHPALRTRRPRRPWQRS
jgi:hypothetical protein